MGLDKIIVTLGAKGAYLHTTAVAVLIKVPPVTEIEAAYRQWLLPVGSLYLRDKGGRAVVASAAQRWKISRWWEPDFFTL